MKNSVIPPKPGEIIALLCSNCKSKFFGPNPGYNSPYRSLFPTTKKTKCPYCGCKRVIPHPAVQY